MVMFPLRVRIRLGACTLFALSMACQPQAAGNGAYGGDNTNLALAPTATGNGPGGGGSEGEAEPTWVQVDLNGDGIPDAFDTNGDDVADAIDTDEDGEPDAYDTDGDGEIDDWDGDGEPDALPPGVDDGDLSNENSDGDGYCFDAESGWRECDDGAAPGRGVSEIRWIGRQRFGGLMPLSVLS